MPTEQELKDQVGPLLRELQKRAPKSRLLERYYEGRCPLPNAIVQARVTKAYRMLMPLAEAPWGSLVVDSVQDRLEVAGIRSGDKAVDDAVWGVWQDNQMDSESKLGHSSALTAGRAFALAWPNGDGVEITLDNAEQMIIQYREGSRRIRIAALRYWEDDSDRAYFTLYRPDGVYKFRETRQQGLGPHDFRAGGKRWERREVTGEKWPIDNPLGIVPAVELPVNRRLRAGSFGYARGEFEHCIGLIDRINLLTFLGLVVAFWMGFPLRAVLGDKILRDDEGKPLAPFEATADSVIQLENPNAKLTQYDAADRENLSIYAELDQLATITKTPRHYMPMKNGMSNLAADAIRASEGGLHAKMPSHKGTLGEGWEELLRVSGLMLPTAVKLSPRAELLWKDHESRSLAERADAATKLKDLLPWQAIAERVLNASADEITRWEAQRSSDAFGQLLAAALQPTPTTPTPPPAPAPAPA